MTDLTLSLKDIAERVGAELAGESNCQVTGVNTLSEATPNQVSFLTNAKYKHQLETTRAAAVIVTAEMVDKVKGNALVHDNPHATFARIAQLFYTPPVLAKGIASSAVIADSARLGENVAIGANVVIGEDVTIDDNTVIGANTVIEQGSQIGANCLIYPNVTLYHKVQVGDDVIIHSQTVIGCDGFGFANDAGNWLPIPQVGTVVVGDKCSIGSGVTIDRGALGNTVIGKNVILDNQVHVAHNCTIDDHACICGATGMAGSTHIGKYVVIGGMCSINGHITIADKVQITGNSMVTNDITEPGVYSSGQPALPNREWRKMSVRTRQLPELFDRVKQLEKK
ncbi:UDP-3-O-(3-hydroxymyristoyl)glucosamine N-acyltransferase [Alteromonas sediminis]|uniref:UDP-3-O-acylglucosamine N-acyltransferase n=1 Tax=Alteromonas sediminis TaxID=2259342 RepID=A0A3N5XZT5_9ALTE|nr:UDP-3-O-(3-hydroxymyristoyl)glucosamine N-acyltransferase [Alteromonas sediminis]RPJ65586.1 UDP-3-O-(3-hydroxymyristoyl)glucosamine N-acyltransferase [Alteromonas sediminis]